MSEHEHGSMDTSAQQATFSGFLRAAMIVGAISILTLIFLALVNG